MVFKQTLTKRVDIPILCKEVVSLVKNCYICKQQKPTSDFPKSVGQGKWSNCKTCLQARVKKPKNKSKRSKRFAKLHPTFSAFQLMKARCLDPNHQSYSRYGGAGISICNRWTGKDGFKNFIADMGLRPSNSLLTRIDTSGNYEPSNCRWNNVPQNEKTQLLESFVAQDKTKN